jgi:hypothetical protein
METFKTQAMRRTVTVALFENCSVYIFIRPGNDIPPDDVVLPTAALKYIPAGKRPEGTYSYDRGKRGKTIQPPRRPLLNFSPEALPREPVSGILGG